MNKTQVLILLEENRNERGIANWERDGHADGGMKSFGIGLTVLRKLAKQVGPIDFSDGSGRKCDPFDPHKHLTSDYLQKKLAG